MDNQTGRIWCQWLAAVVVVGREPAVVWPKTTRCVRTQAGGGRRRGEGCVHRVGSERAGVWPRGPPPCSGVQSSSQAVKSAHCRPYRPTIKLTMAHWWLHTIVVVILCAMKFRKDSLLYARGHSLSLSTILKLLVLHASDSCIIHHAKELVMIFFLFFLSTTRTLHQARE